MPYSKPNYPGLVHNWFPELVENLVLVECIVEEEKGDRKGNASLVYSSPVSSFQNESTI